METETTRFVFVGGVPRSGTSLVQKILDLHSVIYGGPELGILPNLMASYKHLSATIASGKLAMVLNQESVRRSYCGFLQSLYSERLAERKYRFISTKTPQNLLVFDSLAEVFPCGKFIWVIRDPRDVLCSFRAVHKRSQRNGSRVGVGRWLHNDLRMIRRHLSAGEAFQGAHSSRLHVIYYEELLSEPQRVAKSLCDFLDIEFEEQMLTTERSNDVSEAITSNRKTQGVYYTTEMFDRPIDASNIGKWVDGLDTRSLHAVQAHLGHDPLPCLTPYGIGEAGWAWKKLFSISEPVSSISRAVARRVGL